jgi:hypothetical protein
VNLVGLNDIVTDTTQRDSARFTLTTALKLNTGHFIGKKWVSRKNIRDVSDTPFGIKREWFVCIKN